MAKKKKNAGGSSGGAPAWMVTYGDMMTLLLTFFVLILSFSSIQEAEFNKAVGSLKGALGILGDHDYIISLGRIIVPESTYSFMSRRQRQTTGEISKNLNFVSEYENVEIHTDDRGINIILPAALLFASGDDRLRDDALPLLKKLGAFMFELQDKTFRIEGHTDNIPIHTIQFPSNWHLSAARAISVGRFFSEVCGISNAAMSISGYAEFQPRVSNDSEENRAKNRRVQILIETGQ